MGRLRSTTFCSIRAVTRARVGAKIANMITPKRLLSLLLLVAVSACAEESSANADALSLAQRLDAAPAQAADAVVLWSVTSGSPDYMYVFGKTAVNDRAFTLRLDSRLPAEAVNS